jgi:CheY-like chemotaxis protein
LGFVLSEAATVAQALRALENRPQWVLLDLMLPDGSGIEVLRKIKSEKAPTRVIVITGCGPALRRQALDLKPDHLFTKPIDVNRLIDLLTQVA